MRRTDQLKVRVYSWENVQIRRNARARGYDSVAEFVRAVAAYIPTTKESTKPDLFDDLGF